MDQPEHHPDNKTAFSGFASTALLIWDFLKIVLVAVLIILPVRYFIFQPFIVSGSSMEPNFDNGQYLIIDEISYHFHAPQRGDVIVLHYPKDRKQFFIKRIIGLPGEKIKIENGRVTVFNGENSAGITLQESYLPNQGLTYPHDTLIVGGQKTLTLASDEYFMLGDNRLASSDSRDWGILKRSDMVGKVFLRVLPLNELKAYTKPPAYSF